MSKALNLTLLVVAVLWLGVCLYWWQIDIVTDAPPHMLQHDYWRIPVALFLLISSIVVFKRSKQHE